MANDSSITEALVPIVREAVERFLQSRRDFLSRAKAAASQDLINSLAEDVSADVSNGLIEVLIKFERSGRYLDMKKGKHSGISKELIKELEAWVKEKGLKPKKRGASASQRDPAKVANSIAWGIAKRKMSKNTRRKQWWNRPKGYFIGRLANEIMAASSTEAMKQIKAEFRRGQQLLNSN